MVHSSPSLLPPANTRFVRQVGRRDFLKQCGFAGLAVIGAVTLAGCESGREIGQTDPSTTNFFADGTDFAD